MKRKTGGSLNDADSWREELTYLKTSSWTDNMHDYSGLNFIKPEEENGGVMDRHYYLIF